MFPGFRLDPAQVTEPNLILAGDIADPSADEYRLFLGHCSQLFERVFVDPVTMRCMGSRVWRKPHRPHVTCATLCRTYTSHTVSFRCWVGSTHHRDDPLVQDPKERSIQRGCFIGDFRHIRGLDVYKYNYHATDVEWLDRDIARRT
jgi:hypothetical protein